MPKYDLSELRNLYLTKSPDGKNEYTKSILFSWGKFDFNQFEKEVEFYLVNKDSLEEYIQTKIDQEVKKRDEEWIQALEKRNKAILS